MEQRKSVWIVLSNPETLLVDTAQRKRKLFPWNKKHVKHIWILMEINI